MYSRKSDGGIHAHNLQLIRKRSTFESWDPGTSLARERRYDIAVASMS